jgi:shikimate kinase
LDPVARKNIVLIGFMGTGKSSVGRILARKLRFRFVDTDRLIVDLAGIEIPEIFRLHGEAHFRQLEHEILESLIGLNCQIVSTGGGIVLREDNRPLLKKCGFVAALTANESVLFERVSRNSNRPLLQTENPRKTICEMLAQRRALYEDAAQLTVDTSDLTTEAVAQRIADAAAAHFEAPDLP